MCIGYPARVTGLVPPEAIVESGGRLRRASTVVVPDVVVGDFVVIAAGTIIQRLTPEEARDVQTLLDAAMTGSDTERSR